MKANRVYDIHTLPKSGKSKKIWDTVQKHFAKAGIYDIISISYNKYRWDYPTIWYIVMQDFKGVYDKYTCETLVNGIRLQATFGSKHVVYMEY
jgi:hypothetical protein